jgi:hypothetical protein
MNWKPQLFKPKWQHSDPDVRREAVAGQQEPELLAELESICREDEDPGVRAAAAARVENLDSLANALQSEPDKGVTAAIRRRLTELAASSSKQRPPLEQRLALVNQSGERELLEQVALHAPEPELRTAALQRIERQGFLGDRAIQDPDPEVRRAAASAITQRSTLQRVIEESRTRDKALHQTLSARLKEELLEAGDSEAVRQEALLLCVSLEEFAVGHLAEAATVPSELAARWTRLADKAPDDLARRFARATARVEAPEQQARQQQAPEPPAEPAEPEAPAEPTEPEAMAQIEPSAAEPAPDTAEQADRAAAAQKLDQKAKKAQELLERYQTQLEDGALHKALETRHTLLETGKQLKSDRRWKPIHKKLSELHGRLRELRDWQHWSNDKVREELIAEMKILPQADLHPDAMIDRIKALQKRWKELEHSEQIPDDQHFAAAPWMWRKFRAAGNRAFSAAKPFLEKRSELQGKHEQELKDQIDALAALTEPDPPDWSALAKALREARKAFTTLDQLPKKARKKLASKLRKTIDKANGLMQGHYDEVEKQKRKLIREAEQLAHVEDRDEAIRRAKQLQADWKAAGSLWRSRENPLWEAFRAPIDPLFADLKAKRQDEQQAQQQRLASQQALCAELDEILQAEDEALTAADGKVKGLQGRWTDIEHPDRKLRARFDRQVQQFSERLKTHRERSAQSMRQRWWDKAQILNELENALLQGTLKPAAQKKLVGRWPAGEFSEDPDRLLDQRLADALAGKPAPDQDALSQATALCIQLEFLSGLPSPEADRGRRMEYQVQRLALSMSGEGSQLSAIEEARIAEQQWLALPALEVAEHARLKKRIMAALEEIYGHEQ